MRFYTKSHKHTCGIDLHARSLYLCILDASGATDLHKKIDASPQAFLDAIAPFRDDLVVGVECTFSWYWLADLCAEHHIPFVLAHALYLRAIHGAKAKNDRLDAYKLAVLLRSGCFPLAFVYPRPMRATRDLLRRRNRLVRLRAELAVHIQNSLSQYNLPPPSGKLSIAANRIGISARFSDDAARSSVELDLSLIQTFDTRIVELERFLLAAAHHHDPNSLFLLRTIPGVGKILALVILYEVGDIHRFPSVADFVSYCRLVTPLHESAGKITGHGRKKIGNPHLRWAFGEAAALFLRCNPQGQRLHSRLERRHGKARALAVLAHRLARATYLMLRRKTPFNISRFIAGQSRPPAPVAGATA